MINPCLKIEGSIPRFNFAIKTSFSPRSPRRKGVFQVTFSHIQDTG